jgi:transposase
LAGDLLLPREVETIAQKLEGFPDCGGTLRPLGEDVSEVMDTFLVLSR